MNFGSSVLHIVVEPATDCSRYVGVEDTIEQLWPWMRYACSMVAFVDGGFSFGSHIFHHQFLDLCLDR